MKIEDTIKIGNKYFNAEEFIDKVLVPRGITPVELEE